MYKILRRRVCKDIGRWFAPGSRRMVATILRGASVTRYAHLYIAPKRYSRFLFKR